MSWAKLELKDLVVANYGKALKKDNRNETGDFFVYGSSGCVGNHDNALLNSVTIIVGRKGSVGKIIWAPDGGWVIDTAYYLTIRDETVLDWRYLYYALNTLDLEGLSITTSIPGLNRDDFYSCSIPVPPIAEQKRIAAILDKANSIQDKRLQAIELADKLLHDTFLTMFGDPVTNPKKWNQKRLCELGKISTGATPPSKEDGCFDGPVPFVTPGDLGGIINSTNRTLSLKGALHSRICGPNSLLVCCIGATIGKVGLSKIESAFNQQINAVDWNDEINSIFGYFMFKVCPQLITDKAIKTTLPILKKSLFQDIQVICPPLDIQVKFEKIYERAQSYYSLINNDKENSLFNALSQKAFKGEL